MYRDPTKQREANRANLKAWRRANAEHVNASQRQWRANNPDKALSQNLRKRYGISLEDRTVMIASQNGRCAICRDLFADDKLHKPNIDHDHTSGKIRAVLCTRCNLAVGYLRDDPSLAYAAGDYLKTHSTGTKQSHHAS